MAAWSVTGARLPAATHLHRLSLRKVHQCVAGDQQKEQHYPFKCAHKVFGLYRVSAGVGAVSLQRCCLLGVLLDSHTTQIGHGNRSPS